MNVSENVCRIHGVIENGKILPHKAAYNVGEKARYACDIGYRLSGSNSSTCKETGEFSSKLPQCKRKYKSMLI